MTPDHLVTTEVPQQVPGCEIPELKYIVEDGDYRPMSEEADAYSGHINLGADFADEQSSSRYTKEQGAGITTTDDSAKQLKNENEAKPDSEISQQTISTRNSKSKPTVKLSGSKPDIVRCSKRSSDAPSSSTSGESGSTRRRALSFGSKPHWLSKFLKDDKTPIDPNKVHSGTTPSDDVWTPDSDPDAIHSKDDEAETDVDAWRLSLHEFTSKRQGSKRKAKSVPQPLRSFYKRQDELIDQFKEVREVKASGSQTESCNTGWLIIHIFRQYSACYVMWRTSRQILLQKPGRLIDQFEEIRLEIDDAMENTEYIRKLRSKASLFAKITFLVNLVLLAIKIVAVMLSGSISLISSLVDSAVDLLSGIVIWLATRAVKKTDHYVYPQGRTKLEPIAIVILSVIMAAASLQLIKESTTKIVGLADSSQSPPIMTAVPVTIACATVVIKLILFLVCRRVPHPTIQALAQDHRNDVLSNSVAVVFGYIGSQQMLHQTSIAGLVYLDPIGAIIICVYIIVSWCITGWGQIKLLVGHTATPEFLSKITWIAVDHHRKIRKVDTVSAFHFGNNFLVEIDIVLPPDMTLREAHDIAEPLQSKLERLPEVERAFVHADYEYIHKRISEHKIV